MIFARGLFKQYLHPWDAIALFDTEGEPNLDSIRLKYYPVLQPGLAFNQSSPLAEIIVALV